MDGMDKALLDKVVDLTVNTINIQGQFNKELALLKVEMERIDDSICAILELMRAVPNKELLATLLTLRESGTNLLKLTDDIKDKLSQHEKVLQEVKKESAESNLLYKAVVAILTLITLAVAGIQVVNKIGDKDRDAKIDAVLLKIERMRR